MRSRPAGPATSCPARCCSATAPSTGCPRAPPPTRSAAPWSTRCWRRSSTCRRRSGRRPRRTAARARLGGAAASCSRQAREVAATLDEPAWLDSAHERARPLVHAGGPDPARARRARGLRRGHARLRAARCAASSTGSTRRPTAPCESSTTRPGQRCRRGVRVQGPVPAARLRADPVAHPRRRAADAAAGLPRHAPARSSATSPTRPTCSPPSARSTRSGRPSSWPRRPASSCPAGASSATGAPSRRTARRGAASCCRCPLRPRAGPGSSGPCGAAGGGCGDACAAVAELWIARPRATRRRRVMLTLETGGGRP